VEKIYKVARWRRDVSGGRSPRPPPPPDESAPPPPPLQPPRDSRRRARVFSLLLLLVTAPTPPTPNQSLHPVKSKCKLKIPIFFVLYAFKNNPFSSSDWIYFMIVR
jgi:hypothetical protein